MIVRKILGNVYYFQASSFLQRRENINLRDLISTWSNLTLAKVFHRHKTMHLAVQRWGMSSTVYLEVRQTAITYILLFRQNPI